MLLNKTLLEAIKRENFFSEIFLVPGTVPKKRFMEKVEPILDIILKPEDTKTFLIYLRELAGKTGALKKEEIFTFSYPGIGRLRVTYGVQRGSYYLTVLKVPSEIPPIEEFFAEPKKFEKLLISFFNLKGKKLSVFGNNWFINATFIHFILDQLETKGGKVTLTIENPLAYLLKHRNGIVIQKELYVDIFSLEEALKSIPLIEPDFLYIFDALNIYTLPINEVFYYTPPSTNIFFNFPTGSEEILKNFLMEKANFPAGGWIGIKIYSAPSGLFDFMVIPFK